MAKIALLIGINYEGTNAELRGCINDIENTKKVIEERLGYDEVQLMTDHTEILISYMYMRRVKCTELESPTLYILDTYLDHIYSMLHHLE